MDEIINRPTKSMLEMPFWRKGMTYAEFEEERAYWYQHLDDFKENEYTPLWKQRMLQNNRNQI